MKLAERELERIWRSQPPLWLRGLAGLYALGWRVYEGVYRLGLKRRVQLPVPVIGVGSLWAGGVGKTPVTIAIARLLHESGRRVAVLTHGYGGSRYRTETLIDPHEYPDPAEVGDEAAELRLALPDVPIAVGKWRVRTAQAAVARWSPEVLVLDDGFQHLPLARTLDLILLPAESPLGNGYCLPAGPLREPPSGLQRAGGIVLTSPPSPLSVNRGGEWASSASSPSLLSVNREGEWASSASSPSLLSVNREGEWASSTSPPSPLSVNREGEQDACEGCTPPSPFTERGDRGVRFKIPTYRASITPTSLLHLATGEQLPLHALRNHPLTLICGIARPERFVQTAQSLGYTIVSVHAFLDHHAYTPDELRCISGKTVLTTAKDAVKLRVRLPETYDAYALLLEAHLDNALQQRLLSLFTGTSQERRKL